MSRWEGQKHQRLTPAVTFLRVWGLEELGRVRPLYLPFRENRIPPVIKYQHDTKKEHREIRFD